MAENRFSRRYFFYGTLLAGAVPPGGFTSAQSLKAAGLSPNEKLNVTAIGGGGQAFNDINDAEAGVENVVAIADVDFARGVQAFEVAQGGKV